MQVLRMFSLFDAGVGAFLKPFWSDHKENALRSLRQLVNDKSNPDNMVANHPDQFVLFEIGVFDSVTGVFSSHLTPQSLGNCIEFVTRLDNPVPNTVSIDRIKNGTSN